jgi:hypothetical protein
VHYIVKKKQFNKKRDLFKKDKKRIRQKFKRFISRFSPAGRERL